MEIKQTNTHIQEEESYPSLSSDLYKFFQSVANKQKQQITTNEIEIDGNMELQRNNNIGMLGKKDVENNEIIEVRGMIGME